MLKTKRIKTNRKAKSMKIYVSCPSNNLVRAADVMLYLLTHGHEITHDWVKDIRAGEENLPAKQLAKRSVEVLEAVAEADVFVLVIENKNVSLGCGVELGVALYNKIPVLALELETRDFEHFFMFYPEIKKVYSYESLLEELETK
jgi:hypothetical protein